jgi:DNA mismatch repair protein MutS
MLLYGHDIDIVYMNTEDIQALLNDKKRSLLEAYLELHTHFETVYGPNTLLLMEVGSFFEIYGVDNDKETIGKPREIADILNIQLTRKDKRVKENNAKNPLMAGFPTATFDRYITRLIQEKKYTIVIIRQKGTPPNIIRYVDNILSPGVNIDYCIDHQDNFIASIIVEKHHDIYSIGYAAIDVSTGKTYLFETHSTKEDKTAALDELFRLLQSHNTAELILSTNGESIDQQKILDYLEFGEFEQVHLRHTRVPISYQNELFKKAYTIESFLSPVEFLDIEKNPLTSEALAHLIEFIVDHDARIIEQLKKPIILDTSRYLYLGNNPLEQLNIISYDPREATVLSLFDKTVTSIGKRLFKDRLENPITNKNDIEAQYNLSDWLIPLSSEIDTHLKKVYDLERLSRRIALTRLHPFEINFLYDSLLATAHIIEIIKEEENAAIEETFQTKAGTLQDFIAHIESIFNLDQTNKVTRHTITRSLFQTGFHRDIDALITRRKEQEEKLEQIKTTIATLLEDKNGKDHTDYIGIKQLDKEGHYIHMTKSRYALIEEEIKKSFVSLNGTVYALSDFTYKVQTTNVKITAPIIDRISEEITLIQTRITALTRELFDEQLRYIQTTFSHQLDIFTDSLAKIDVALSNIKSSLQHRLARPTIIDTTKDSSYLSLDDLRHPLVETKEEQGIYIPNSLVLGSKEHYTDQDKLSVITTQSSESISGLLLYGINASGKSSLMKSLGISIILAQSGLYVPASSMTFSICTEIFTRIVAKDNFEKGLSSFAVEMVELKNIFNRCTSKSLILGDEISHGTETLSAISIVAATIKRLTETGSLFLFTTHLHQLHSLGMLKDNPHVASTHMSVHYDTAADRLIFDRLLQSGNGNSVYGLEFAHSLHMDPAFLKYAMGIRKSLAKEYTDLELLTKQQKSKYNSNLILTTCAICKNNVEDVHHIAPQKSADDHGNITHFHKNHKYNLLPICKSCHTKVHDKIIHIKGFMMTDKGLELTYEQTDSSSS